MDHADNHHGTQSETPSLNDVQFGTKTSAYASLNNPPPRTAKISPNFLTTFFSHYHVTPTQSHYLFSVVTFNRFTSMGSFTWPFLVWPARPLHRYLRPFTTHSDQCSWGETQTMSHIVESCPQTRLHGGLSKLHSADDDAVACWLIMAPNANNNNNNNNWLCHMLYSNN